MSRFFKSELFKITVYVVCVISFGALLAPGLYNWGKSAVASGIFEGKKIPLLGIDFHDELERAPLRRYFTRATQLGAILFIWPLFRWLNLKPRDVMGLKPNPQRLLHFAVGLGLALAGMVVVGVILLMTGVFEISPSHPGFGKVLQRWAITALVVAIFEEFFFRGCVLGLVRRNASKMTALIFVSAFFAGIHFLKPPSEYVLASPQEFTAERAKSGRPLVIPEGAELVVIHPFADPKIKLRIGEKTHRILLSDQDQNLLGIREVRWTTGFWLLGQIFAQFGNPMFIIAELSTLFIIGLILGYTRLKTSSLSLAIGLHGGWVLSYESYRAITVKRMQDTLPWVGDDLKSGLVAIMMVVATGALTWIFLKRTWPADQTAVVPGD